MSERAGGDSGRSRWAARYRERTDEVERVPSPWVVTQCLALRPDALIGDLAGGTGRHAVPLARAGRRVILIDFVERAVASAVEREARVVGLVADLADLPLRGASLDAAVCVNFLERSLFAAFAALLRPGGTLVYETFTRAHLDVVARGRAHGPRNPAYLLEPGELVRLVAPLDVTEHEERLVLDDAGERHVARVVARRR